MTGMRKTTATPSVNLTCTARKSGLRCTMDRRVCLTHPGHPRLSARLGVWPWPVASSTTTPSPPQISRAQLLLPFIGRPRSQWWSRSRRRRGRASETLAAWTLLPPGTVPAPPPPCREEARWGKGKNMAGCFFMKVKEAARKHQKWVGCLILFLSWY